MEAHKTLMQTISHTQSAGDTKYSCCSIQKDEDNNVKMQYCWWLIMDQCPMAEKTTTENHFHQCPTGIKQLRETMNSQMYCWAWHHHHSHSFRHLCQKCPNPILIMDKALTADKTLGSQFWKVVARNYSNTNGLLTQDHPSFNIFTTHCVRSLQLSVEWNPSCKTTPSIQATLFWNPSLHNSTQYKWTTHPAPPLFQHFHNTLCHRPPACRKEPLIDHPLFSGHIWNPSLHNSTQYKWTTHPGPPLFQHFHNTLCHRPPTYSRVEPLLKDHTLYSGHFVLKPFPLFRPLLKPFPP